MTRIFEYQLDQLRTNIIKMGSLVDEQIDFAIKALMESDVELAALVKERDTKVNEFDNLIDRECEEIFALTQPVAIDLRLIVSTLKINNELERIGDIAVNIVERLEPLRKSVDLIRNSKIPEMADRARKMVKLSIDSFVNSDAALAREICASDDIVDNLDWEIFQSLIQQMNSDPAVVEPGAHLMILSRHLERLADHATNIAEDVIFLVDAKIVKHGLED